MERLPHEIVCRIFSYLQSPDLKHARLVSSDLKTAASRHLFSRILIAPRRDVLSVFRRVYEHDTYRLYVKQIVYDGSIYDVSLARSAETYISSLIYAEDGDRLLRLVTIASGFGIVANSMILYLRQSYERYLQACIEQEKIRAAFDDWHALIRGLEAMPGVRRLTYSNHTGHHLPAESITKDIAVVARCVQSAAEGDYAHLPRLFRDRGVFTMLHAMTEVPGNTVREIRLRGHLGHGISPNFFCRDIPDVRRAGTAFNHVHTIQLDFHNPHCDDVYSASWSSYDEYLNGRTLGSFLDNACALERLEMSFTTVCWAEGKEEIGQLCDEQGPMLPIFLGRTTWSRLRVLKLAGLAAHEAEFADLLKRHASTLEHVSLTKCLLSTGLWANLIKVLVFRRNVRHFLIVDCYDHLNENEDGYNVYVRAHSVPYQVQKSDKLPKLPCNPAQYDTTEPARWTFTRRVASGAGFWTSFGAADRQAMTRRVLDGEGLKSVTNLNTFYHRMSLSLM